MDGLCRVCGGGVREKYKRTENVFKRSKGRKEKAGGHTKTVTGHLVKPPTGTDDSL